MSVASDTTNDEKLEEPRDSFTLSSWRVGTVKLGAPSEPPTER